jgi:hypothetical protein
MSSRRKCGSIVLWMLPRDATTTIVNDGGDPAYTNQDVVALRIASRIDECAGLTSYSVDFGTPPGGSEDPAPAAAKELGPTGELVSVPLPVGSDGPYTFAVTMVDKNGFSTTTQHSVVKDKTDPQASLLPGSAITPTVESGSYLQLNLSGLRATDNYPGGGGGRNYWGFQVLAQEADDEAPGIRDPEWATHAMVIPGTAPDSLDWNALLGLVGDFTPGESYKFYVQVLDGAGNPSNVLASSAIKIDAPSGQLFLPSVMR